MNSPSTSTVDCKRTISSMSFLSRVILLNLLHKLMSDLYRYFPKSDQHRHVFTLPNLLD